MFIGTAYAAGGNHHLFQIFWGSDPVVKLTLLVLIGLSIASWTIIIYKHKELKRLNRTSVSFFDSFWRSRSLEELFKKQARSGSPLTNIFHAAMTDLVRNPRGESSKALGLNGIRRRVERSVDDEVDRLERYVPFLATTGSSAPFIGLFGTVWGYWPPSGRSAGPDRRASRWSGRSSLRR